MKNKFHHEGHEAKKEQKYFNEVMFIFLRDINSNLQV